MCDERRVVENQEGEDVIERGVPGNGAHSIRNGRAGYTYGVDTINSQETDSCRREEGACQKKVQVDTHHRNGHNP